jgi:hypothetical protein
VSRAAVSTPGWPRNDQAPIDRFEGLCGAATFPAEQGIMVALTVTGGAARPPALGRPLTRRDLDINAAGSDFRRKRFEERQVIHW